MTIVELQDHISNYLESWSRDDSEKIARLQHDLGWHISTLLPDELIFANGKSWSSSFIWECTSVYTQIETLKLAGVL